MGKASTAHTGAVVVRRVTADGIENVDRIKDGENLDNLDNMQGAGAGWYYDPEDQAIYRYWDGTSWTEHRSDTVLSTVPS